MAARPARVDVTAAGGPVLILLGHPVVPRVRGAVVPSATRDTPRRRVGVGPAPGDQVEQGASKPVAQMAATVAAPEGVRTGAGSVPGAPGLGA